MATLSTISKNGADSNRVDMVFLGDGYTASEINSTYVADVNKEISYLFGGDTLTQPYGKYSKFINSYRINVVSAESGADDPATGGYKNTALDSSYSWDGVTDRLLYVDDTKADAQVTQALAGTGIRDDLRYVTVNSAKYGGGGGRYAVYAGGNASAKEIAVHEAGHSFAGLADEYGSYLSTPQTYNGAEPTQPNVTTSSTGAKWAAWLGYDQGGGMGVVGAYEGGFYVDKGIYRPTRDSKMRTLGQPFNAISREAMILGFYKRVHPIDSSTDSTSTLINPSALQCDVVDPSVISVRWTVNGDVKADGDAQSFNCATLGNGNYTITALAYDNTGWVRTNVGATQQSVSWNVRIDNSTVSTTSVFGSPVYRFFNAAQGTHFFTSSVDEKNSVIQNIPDFKYEGQMFTTINSDYPGAVPVYRFLNTKNNSHFYTIEAAERDNIIATMPEYKLEGIAYSAFKPNDTADAALAGVTPLYRFNRPENETHFYTASLAERDNVIKNMAGTYTYEGVAYYVASNVASAAPMDALQAGIAAPLVDPGWAGMGAGQFDVAAGADTMMIPPELTTSSQPNLMATSDVVALFSLGRAGIDRLNAASLIIASAA